MLIFSIFRRQSKKCKERVSVIINTGGKSTRQLCTCTKWPRGGNKERLNISPADSSPKSKSLKTCWENTTIHLCQHCLFRPPLCGLQRKKYKQKSLQMLGLWPHPERLKSLCAQGSLQAGLGDALQSQGSNSCPKFLAPSPDKVVF